MLSRLYTGGGTSPPIVNTNMSLSQIRSKMKAKRGRNNTVAKSDTVSNKNRITANTGAANDPITAVDGLNNDQEDVKDAKSKVSTM